MLIPCMGIRRNGKSSKLKSHKSSSWFNKS
jgi:hypothetical protein